MAGKQRSCRWVACFATPLERRLQTLAVLIMMLLFFTLILLNLVVLWYWRFTWPVYVAYLAWIALFDRDASNRGGRAPIGRSWSLWKLFRNYFPSDLVSESTLDPTQTYLFAVHPHGVIGMAAWANMMNTVSPVLRSVNYRIVTLASNFWIPISREWLLWLGLIGSNKRGILHCLERGISVAIVIGGAAESLEIHDTYHGIVLDRRRGFVELAVRTGASLVPVFNFGENSLYNTVTDNEQGSKLRHWQERMKSMFGFTLPLVHGRGVWNYSYGLLPFRVPLTTVIGKPIPTKKNPNPSQEEITHYHTLYKEALLALHERWRIKVGETTRLRVIA